MQSWIALFSADSESDTEHNDWQSRNIEEHQGLFAMMVSLLQHDLCCYSSCRYLQIRWKLVILRIYTSLYYFLPSEHWDTLGFTGLFFL